MKDGAAAGVLLVRGDAWGDVQRRERSVETPANFLIPREKWMESSIIGRYVGGGQKDLLQIRLNDSE